MTGPDIYVADHGSICILRGVTRDGLDWLTENLDPEATRWGHAFAVEPRYVGAITDGAADAGLEISLGGY